MSGQQGWGGGSEQPPPGQQGSPEGGSGSGYGAPGTPYPPPPEPPEPPEPYGTGPVAGGPYGRAPETSSAAIVALVAAILSWVFCPVIPAIVALVFCNSAEREIAASGGAKSGAGLVSAARIIAWINLILFGLLLVLLIVGLAISGTSLFGGVGETVRAS